MPITLISAQPGSGKTLMMVDMLHAAAAANEKARKHNAKLAEDDPNRISVRPLICYGINGLAPGEWEVRDDASKWADCPDGSLIFVDEAWTWFGHQKEGQTGKTPQHVLDLATHRHRGMDFVWTTQGPGQIYPFARTLGGEHIHMVRKYNLGMADTWRWQEWQDGVKQQSVRNRGLHSLWRFPTARYASYKSASLHTMKMRIPKQAYYLLACVLLLIGCVFGFNYWRSNFAPTAASAAPGPVASSGDPLVPGGLLSASPDKRSASQAKSDPMLEMRKDPDAMLKPRVHGKLWTAPAYDSVPLAPPPRLACMSGPDRCTCIEIEQGTRYLMDEGTCRYISVMGYYDPTYQAGRQAGQGAPEGRAPPATASGVPAVSASGAPVAASGWSPRPIREHYTQPQAIPDYKGGL